MPTIFATALDVMDILHLFYATNIVAVLISVVLALFIIWVAIHFRRNPLSLCCRIFPFSMLLLGAYKLSTCFIVSGQGIEVLPTQALGLCAACFQVFSMGACAFLRRGHYRNVANWVLLLSPSLLLLFVNQLMTHYGYYRALYSFAELSQFREELPIVFFGRVIFLAVLGVSVILALCFLIDAMTFDKWHLGNRPSDINIRVHQAEIRMILIWTVLILFGFLPLCTGSIWVHVLFNGMYIGALVLSGYIYRMGVIEIRTLEAKEDPTTLIIQRLPLLLDMERGGQTAWGTMVKSNPFFCGKAHIDDVAAALGVEVEDVSAYVSARGSNMVAWMSEQRLLHCAQQVGESDRKIVEIAESCGYNDLPSFTRAFKRQFGVSPSEYRKDSDHTNRPLNIPIKTNS